jgi:hypothetical protein
LVPSEGAAFSAGLGPSVISSVIAILRHNPTHFGFNSDNTPSSFSSATAFIVSASV